tara:strand:- start:8033 stop:8413 length:381 start_codon:yes stop_codon:yes gene_type:complete
MEKLINISDLSILLNLVDRKTKKPLNYIIRYWEKEFKQISPNVIRNRRYYSSKQIELIKLIKFLLKDKGMSIKGAKRVLNSRINNLDDYNSNSLQAEYYKKSLKTKSKKILEKIKHIKRYGKKVSH